MKSAGKTDLRRDEILAAAVQVFGRFGYRKTSVQDIAQAAGLSKPGLYLHFSGKDELFSAAMEKYLSEALVEVRKRLEADEDPLHERLHAAMEAWFGKHLRTFTPEAFDVIEAGDRLSFEKVQEFRQAIAASFEGAFRRAGLKPAVAADRAQVLFLCGLSWKQPGTTPESFRSMMAPCIRVCCTGAEVSGNGETQ